MHGDINTDEKRELEAKIEELSSALDEKNAIHAVLNTQLKRLQVSCNANQEI